MVTMLRGTPEQRAAVPVLNININIHLAKE